MEPQEPKNARNALQLNHATFAQPTDGELTSGAQHGSNMHMTAFMRLATTVYWIFLGAAVVAWQRGVNDVAQWMFVAAFAVILTAISFAGSLRPGTKHA